MRMIVVMMAVGQVSIDLFRHAGSHYSVLLSSCCLVHEPSYFLGAALTTGFRLDAAPSAPYKPPIASCPNSPDPPSDPPTTSGA
jgi:hypothetical protein